MKNAQKTALLSVYNKKNIELLAQELLELGWTLYCSEGTAKYLRAFNIDCRETSELVGGKAILGHRVVTLSREIYAALLATASSSDTAELKQLNIPRVDLVCVDFYPLAEEIANPKATEHSVIEQTDIGGPTLLRAAAKGRRIVISRPEQRGVVIDWLKSGEPDRDKFLRELAATAEAEVAAYVLDSARYHSNGLYDGGVYQTTTPAKYGENPWQSKAWLQERLHVDDPLALSKFTLMHGTSPSYNNFADIDRLLQTMTHAVAGFHQNGMSLEYIALGGKHGNVCGAAVGEDTVEVTKRMLEGDLRAIFGGVMMFNFTIDEKVAETLLTYKVEKGRRLIDGIVAPSISPKAIAMLERKGDKCRIWVNPELDKLSADSIDVSVRFRYVRGGHIVQENYTKILDLKSPDTTSLTKFDGKTTGDIVLGWAIGSTSNSNTITLVKNAQLIGNGVGQQDRVSAAELAVKRALDAGHDISGATAYSDSFFPFPDGPKVLADAGISTIFSSSGSVGDEQVRQACQAAKVNLVMQPDEAIRGFYAH